MKTLNDYQLDRLLTTGFVHVPQLIDAAAVDCALEAINSDLAVSGLDPSRFVDYEGTSFCSEIRYDPAITNLLYKSAVWPVLEDLFGVGRVAPRKRGQIALRFPERATQRQEKVFPGRTSTGSAILEAPFRRKRCTVIACWPRCT